MDNPVNRFEFFNGYASLTSFYICKLSKSSLESVNSAWVNFFNESIFLITNGHVNKFMYIFLTWLLKLRIYFLSVATCVFLSSVTMTSFPLSKWVLASSWNVLIKSTFTGNRDEIPSRDEKSSVYTWISTSRISSRDEI